VNLLEKEMVFNETLGQTIGQIQGISATLRHAQDAAVRNEIGRALDHVNEATEAIGYLASYENTRAIEVLQKQADQLKAAIAEDTTDYWNAILLVDASEKRITLQDEIESMEISSQRMCCLY
jgi:protein transport protein DSL1/ZW10